MTTPTNPIYCGQCGATNVHGSNFCNGCGQSLAAPEREEKNAEIEAHAKPKSPVIAALLSLVLPGMGQVYNGKTYSGITAFFCTVLLYMVIVGVFLHVYLIYEAYAYAKKWNESLFGDQDQPQPQTIPTPKPQQSSNSFALGWRSAPLPIKAIVGTLLGLIALTVLAAVGAYVDDTQAESPTATIATAPPTTIAPVEAPPEQSPEVAVEAVDPEAVQAANIKEFQRRIPGAELIAFVDPVPDNPNAIWIRLEKTWDAESVKGQELSKNLWRRIWDSICHKNPTSSSEEVAITLFLPDNSIADRWSAPMNETTP